MAIKQGSLGIEKVRHGANTISKIYAGSNLIWMNSLSLNIASVIKIPSPGGNESVVPNVTTNVCDYTVGTVYGSWYQPNVYYYNLLQYGGGFTQVSMIFTCTWAKLSTCNMCLGLTTNLTTSSYTKPYLGIHFDGTYRRLYAEIKGVEELVLATDVMRKDSGYKLIITNKLFTVTDMLTSTIVFSKAINVNINDCSYLKWQAGSWNSGDSNYGQLKGVFGVINFE